MRFQLLVLLLVLIKIQSVLAQVHFVDLVKDVHHNINGFCQDLSTDIQNGVVVFESEYIHVEMNMTKDITLFPDGYREFYFWIDVDPKRKNGYAPYLPNDIAWKNFFADYRIFLSINSFSMDIQSSKVSFGLQNCKKSDCSKDLIVKQSYEKLQYHIKDSKITFKIHRSLLPEMVDLSLSQWAFTTYYQLAQCNGEDDYPQWGSKALKIKVPGN